MSDKKRVILPSVDMSQATNKMLDNISDNRKNTGALISTKKGVIAELVLAAHKKECKFANKKEF